MEKEHRTEIARVSGPLVGGRGWPFGSPLDVGRHGCVMEEFLVEGVAVSHTPAPGSTVGLDGHWETEPTAVSYTHLPPRKYAATQDKTVNAAMTPSAAGAERSASVTALKIRSNKCRGVVVLA